MWGLIILMMAILAVAGILTGATALGSLPGSDTVRERVFKGRKLLFTAACILVMAAVFALIARLLSIVNAMVVFLHLAVFLGIFRLIGKIAGRIKGEKVKDSVICFVTFVSLILYLTYAFWNAHHVVIKEYQITSEKVSRGYTVQLVADAHIGSNLDGDGFARQMERLSERDADLLVIAGDFVDDETSREDMIKSCAALGKMADSRKVVYVFGNHDRGYFGAGYRDFSAEDLVRELNYNMVTVLQDRSIDVGELTVIGREDRSVRGRRNYGALTAGLDHDRFILVADHQPKEYDEAASAGVDAVLSGHTHGGQLIPFNRMGQWTGIDDKSYGLEERDGTTFIVTSGISDWEIQFRSGCHAEMVELHIRPE